MKEAVKKKVAYYNMPGDLQYENALLKEWEIDNLQLCQVTGCNIIKDIAGYQGLVTEYTIISEEILQRLPDLQIIALQSVGYDEIDVSAAERLHIDVTNTPGYCAEDVATHAMALLLSVVRQIPRFNRAVREGKWNPYIGSAMYRLSGKTAGIIAFGNIPQKLVPMLKGFGIHVIAYDPVKDKEFIESKGAVRCETGEAVLHAADFVFLHSPLNPATRHMIERVAISQRKDGAILINAARGALIDEDALLDALISGKLAGAGLDVLEDEVERNQKLIALDNVVVTPHAAFLSEDSLKQSRRMALKQLVIRLSEGKTPPFTVNRQRS